MQIRTSIYKNLPRILEHNYVPVAIDTAKPDHPGIISIPELVPNHYIILGVQNGDICPELFKVLYTKQLSRLSASTLISRIMDCTGNGNKICFVSDEKMDKFLIRKILSKWLEKEGFYCHDIFTRLAKAKR